MSRVWWYPEVVITHVPLPCDRLRIGVQPTLLRVSRDALVLPNHFIARTIYERPLSCNYWPI